MTAKMEKDPIKILSDCLYETAIRDSMSAPEDERYAFIKIFDRNDLLDLVLMNGLLDEPDTEIVLEWLYDNRKAICTGMQSRENTWAALPITDGNLSSGEEGSRPPKNWVGFGISVLSPGKEAAL